MRRGTTSTITINVTGTQLSSYIDVWVTFEQNYICEFTKKFSEGEMTIDTANNKISIPLNPKDTLKFKYGADEIVKVQVKARKSNGQVNASPIKTLSIEEILNEEGMINE